MLYQLFFILAVIYHVTAAVYYVEPAPVAPFSCTQAHPCRLSDLPGAFTVADTIVFLPATTGSSSTYSIGSKLYTNPSLILSAGTIFSASTLTARASNSLNCTGAAFVSSSSLIATTVGVVGSVGCNFTASQFTSTGNGVLDFFGGTISGLTTLQRFLFNGNAVTLDGITLKSSTTNLAPILMRTGNAESYFIAKNIVYDTVTTGGGTSAMVIQSTGGIDFDLTVSNVAYNAVVADGALMEFQVQAVVGGGTFYTEIDILQFTAVGGSCKKGFLYANNGDESAQMTANIALSSATGVNFKNGAAFLLSANSGIITLNANDAFNNNICSPTNHLNLAECTGTTINTAFLFSGNDEGSLTTKNCPTVYINGGTTC